MKSPDDDHDVACRATDRATPVAGLVIAVVPLALVFAFATKQIIAGLTTGMSR
ncbi:hypothetical protein [Nonomuraea polychroma]|uniref:hypothetical protein n=1 Tax=Nonomuraea polychroma TaxID=46176 RepID=UPI0013E321AF|nr:hypothetical protein [Nonomuraea polychroma]